MDHGARVFKLPQLPKPEYMALKRLCQLLGATQLETMCVGLRVMARAVRGDFSDPTLDALRAMLEDFRRTAPVDTAPLL